MKSHPGAAILHVLSEGRSLGGIFRSGIQKHHDLKLGEETGVELAPIIGRIVGKTVLSGRVREPFVGLAHKAYMRRIALARVEGDHFKRTLLHGGCRARVVNSGLGVGGR
jgi:hypothetical protein